MRGTLWKNLLAPKAHWCEQKAFNPIYEKFDSSWGHSMKVTIFDDVDEKSHVVINLDKHTEFFRRVSLSSISIQEDAHRGPPNEMRITIELSCFEHMEPSQSAIDLKSALEGCKKIQSMSGVK